jgi:hypothetical protein
MPQRKRRADKLDGIDADHVSTVLRSAGWQLIWQRIERTIESKVAEVLQPLDPVKTAEVRGMIQGLKLALGVPAILQAEAAANRGAGKEGDGSIDES